MSIDRAASCRQTISHLPCITERCADDKRPLEQPRRQHHAHLLRVRRSSASGLAGAVQCVAADRPGSGVEPIVLAEPTAQQLSEQTQRLARQVTAWLDDEWLPQDVHRNPGDAAAEVSACGRVRGDGTACVLATQLDAAAPPRNNMRGNMPGCKRQRLLVPDSRFGAGPHKSCTYIAPDDDCAQALITQHGGFQALDSAAGVREAASRRTVGHRFDPAGSRGRASGVQLP